MNVHTNEWKSREERVLKIRTAQEVHLQLVWFVGCTYVYEVFSVIPPFQMHSNSAWAAVFGFGLVRLIHRLSLTEILSRRPFNMKPSSSWFWSCFGFLRLLLHFLYLQRKNLIVFIPFEMSIGRMGRLWNEKFLGGITVNLKGWRNNREYRKFSL